MEQRRKSRFAARRFLFEELVKRDFKRKYKGSVLGVAWSVLSPLLMLAVMRFIFTNFFGRTVQHYTTYLFAGLLVFEFFSDSASAGMRSLVGNAGIFTKVNVPKYLFLFSRNMQSLLNFLITLLVFFAFCAIDGVPFTWRFALLVYPIVTLALFNLGLGFILSALFVFFRDLEYLWSIATRMVMWGSAIFYTTETFSPEMKFVFRCNPVYDHIDYVRQVVLDGVVPGWELHAILAGMSLAVLAVGMGLYKRYNTEFLYHV